MKKRKRLSLFAGILVFAVFALAAALPEWFTAYGQKQMFAPWMRPGAGHLLGTNALGYDIYTEVVYGVRTTLIVGMTASLLTLLLGGALGILAAGHGVFAGMANGLIHIFLLVPRLVSLIVLSTFLGNSTRNLILLITLFGWVGTARNVRAKVIHLQGAPFLENLRIQGLSEFRIAFYHLIPNLYDVLISRFLLGINSCIMMESTLSFLGFGDLYYPTWGTMINFAYKRGALLRKAYAYLLAPGLCICCISLSFFLISRFFEAGRDSISNGKEN